MHNTHFTDSKPDSGLHFDFSDEISLLNWAEKLASCLHAGMTIHLSGTLGAGKTTLTRGILHGLGYIHIVRSPTYNLVEIYKISRLYLYHFDFYRFNDRYEWEEAGFREYFNPDSICIVEWPEKAGDLLPTADIQIFLEIVDSGRSIVIRAGTDIGNQCLEKLKNQIRL